LPLFTESTLPPIFHHRNYTLRYIPYPVNDCVAAMKQSPERVQLYLEQVQELLLRNFNVNKSSNDQQFRLQRVVNSTAQQVLDKLGGNSSARVCFRVVDENPAGHVDSIV